MKQYSNEDVKELVKQAVDLKIPLYKETTIADIEVLVKHELLKSMGNEIPVN